MQIKKELTPNQVITDWLIMLCSQVERELSDQQTTFNFYFAN